MFFDPYKPNAQEPNQPSKTTKTVKSASSASPIKRLMTLGALGMFLATPVFAWTPQLDEASAKQVIDAAYGRIDPIKTFLNLNLEVKDGKFISENAVQIFKGSEGCLETWLSNPQDFATGSRPTNINVIGQADELFFQATTARDNFDNLSAETALTEAYATKRLAAGTLRVDVNVQGLPTERARDAYVVGLRTKDGKLIRPNRRSFVDNFKQVEGKWQGTLVYYFPAAEAGIQANDKINLLFRTEADTDCAYQANLDLSTFQ